MMLRILLLLVCFCFGSTPQVRALVPPREAFLEHQQANASWREVLEDMEQLYQAGSVYPLLENNSSQSLLDSRDYISVGTVSVMVVLVQFSDHAEANRPLVSRDDIDAQWQGRIQDWIAVNSHGALQIQPVVFDWVVTDNTEEFYANGQSGFQFDFLEMAFPALDALDADPNFDWSRFDVNNDGDIDAFVIYHSGHGAETTTSDCFGRAYQDRIWAHARGKAQNRPRTWQSRDGSINLRGYTVQSAIEGNCGTQVFNIGVSVHEFLHPYGIIDLYDTGGFLGNGLGNWDIMANPYGIDGNIPGHVSSWVSQELGWTAPTEITTDGMYILRPWELFDDSYKISLGFNSAGREEYLLLENRQREEYDIFLPGTGLAIYHVDENVFRQNKRGFPGQIGWPENGNHYKVALLQADGDYDLETKGNMGDAGDMWKAPMRLGPGMNGLVYPNTDRYQDGNIRQTGISVDVLYEDASMEIAFMVMGLETKSPTSAPSASTTDSPVSVPTLQPTAMPSGPSPVPTGATETPTLDITRRPSPVPTAATDAPTIDITRRPTPSPNFTFGPTSFATVTRRPTLPPEQTFGPTSFATVTRRPTPGPTRLATPSPTEQSEEPDDTNPGFILSVIQFILYIFIRN